VAGLSLALITGCSSAENSAELDDSSQTGEKPSFELDGENIRITFGDASAQSLGNRYMIAQLEGWGATVDDIALTTATGLSAIIAGQADFAAGQGADEAILGLAMGADLTAIGAPDSANSYVVIARSEIESIEDLRGARIATSGPGGFNTALMYLALQNAGIDPDSDASLLSIGGSPERAAALLTGNVDATVVFYADWAQIQAQSDDVHLLAVMDELVPNIPDLYYYGETAYWDEHPEVALAVACANLNANAIISQDKEAFVDFAASSITGSDREITDYTYDRLIELDNWPTEPEEIMNLDGLDALQELLLQTGDLESPTDIGDLVDLSYLEEAQEMGCGVSD
jgi:NitT/TauT family transport system substrate-binding protein